MFKLGKLLLCIMVSLMALAATTLPNVSHAEDVDLSIIKDSEEERVVMTELDGVVTTAVFNKKENILTIEEDGKETIVLNIGQLAEEYLDDNRISDSDKPEMSLMATTTEQNTFINYEYTITHGSPEKWQLRRPDGDSLFYYFYKNVTRTTTNKDDLDKFQGYVENINYYEWKAIGGSLTSLGLSWLSFILSVPTAGAGTLTTGLAALGAYGAALDALLKIHENANYANTYYHRIW